MTPNQKPILKTFFSWLKALRQDPLLKGLGPVKLSRKHLQPAYYPISVGRRPTRK